MTAAGTYEAIEVPTDGRAAMRFHADWAREDWQDFERPLAALEAILDRPGADDDRVKWARQELAKRFVASRWDLYGRQSVVMPHRYAAALMATDYRDALPAPPWPAFEVIIPSGLLHVAGAGEAQAVYIFDDPQVVPPAPRHITVLVVFERITVGSWVTEAAFQALTHITTDEEHSTGAYRDLVQSVDEVARAAQMALRLLANTVLHIVTTPGAIPAKHPPFKLAHGKRVANTLKIGKPLDLDCRREIREYVEGKRRSEPKVTTLVRGHWRRQVHGVGNKERKLIWIQPFFRGHGPMLVRPAHVGFGQRAENDNAASDDGSRSDMGER